MFWFPVIIASWTLAAVRHIDARDTGYNGCHNRTWTYYSHTHTCLATGEKNKTWWEGWNLCRNFKGGIDGDITGHLVRIDDEETNNFIKKNFLSNNSFYKIGLYNTSEEKVYRWAGFPYETQVPKVHEMKDKSTIERRYLVIKKDGWYHVRNIDRSNYLCEHEAKIPRSTMSCPSTPVNVNDGVLSSRPVECQFYFNHWHSAHVHPTGSSDPSVRCINGSDTTACEIDTSQSGHRTTLRFNGSVTLGHNGSWTCEVYQKPNNNILLDTKSCGLRAYKAPTSTKCTSALHPRSLNVSCSTKIFPMARCQFSYRKENGSMATITNISYTHTLYRKNQPDMYYASECSFSWPSEDRKLTAGKVTIQVQIHPDMEGISGTTTPVAFYTQEEHVEIKRPKAVFTINNSTMVVTSDATIRLPNDGLVTLECHLRNGLPDVLSTTISCQFPISLWNATSVTNEGPVVRLTIAANSSMAGKTCVCWGNHLTGKTDKVMVTWTSGMSEDTDDTGLIIGLVVALVLLLVVVIIVTFFLLRRRRNRMEQPSAPSMYANEDGKDVQGKGFANYAIVNNKKGRGDNPGFCLDEHHYDNESEATTRPCNDEQLQDRREEHTYSNVEPLPLSQNAEKTNCQKEVGEISSKSKRGKDVLVYTDVVFDGQTTGPMIKGDDSNGDGAKAPESTANESRAETVEYTSVSVTATIKLKEKQVLADKD